MCRLRVCARVYVTGMGFAGAGGKPFAPVPGKWGPEVERDIEAHEPTVGGARADAEDAPRVPSREVRGACPCENACVRAARAASFL